MHVLASSHLYDPQLSFTGQKFHQAVSGAGSPRVGGASGIHEPDAVHLFQIGHMGVSEENYVKAALLGLVV